MANVLEAEKSGKVAKLDMLIDARIMAMRNLVIIGAGGFGRTVYGIALECEGYGSFYTVKGFLDDNLNALENFPNYPPIVGCTYTYKRSVRKR